MSSAPSTPRSLSITSSGPIVHATFHIPGRKFSSSSPLGLGSSSDGSGGASRHSGEVASAPLMPSGTHKKAHARFASAQKDVPSTADAGHAEASTEATTGPAPRQGAIPALLLPWTEAPPTTSTRSPEFEEMLPGENDTTEHTHLAMPDTACPSTRFYSATSAPLSEETHLLLENQVLRSNVDILKTLALQLAAQLDLAQARNALHTKGDDSHDKHNSTPMPTQAVSSPSLSGSSAREEALLAALKSKDELIATLTVQLRTQEEWYEQVLQRTLEEKNAVIETLLREQGQLTDEG